MILWYFKTVMACKKCMEITILAVYWTHNISESADWKYGFWRNLERFSRIHFEE